MGKYIKILFEPFFADKKFYLKHIFIRVFFLILGLLIVELVRNLILSIEKNT